MDVGAPTRMAPPKRGDLSRTGLASPSVHRTCPEARHRGHRFAGLQGPRGSTPRRLCSGAGNDDGGPGLLPVSCPRFFTASLSTRRLPCATGGGPRAGRAQAMLYRAPSTGNLSYFPLCRHRKADAMSNGPRAHTCSRPSLAAARSRPCLSTDVATGGGRPAWSGSDVGRGAKLQGCARSHLSAVDGRPSGAGGRFHARRCGSSDGDDGTSILDFKKSCLGMHGD